jgi:hypothetical protein
MDMQTQSMDSTWAGDPNIAGRAQIRSKVVAAVLMGIDTPIGGSSVICEKHGWTKKTLPCPYLCCPNGARGHFTVAGNKTRVVYVRTRDKTEWGPVYNWEKTTIDPNEVSPAPVKSEAGDERVDEIVF